MTEHIDLDRSCGVKITFDGHDHGGTKIRRRRSASVIDCLCLGQVNNVGDLGDAPGGNVALEGVLVGIQGTLNGWRYTLASQKSTVFTLTT